MSIDPIRAAIQGVMPAVRATGLLVSLATFQVPDGLTDGGFVSPNYVDVPGLTDIACTAPPVGISTGFSANEEKAQEAQQAKQEFHVLLDDFYPAVNDVWRAEGRVLIDGNAWDVIGVEHDSQSVMTRVRVSNATI